MKLSIPILLLSLLWSGIACAQSRPAKFLLEVSAGTDLGWWLYQKGSVNSYLDQGQDYTHHSATVSVEADILYRIQRVKLGVGLSFSSLFEDEMNGTRNSEFVRDEYLVTEGSTVNFTRFNVQVEYDLIRREKYTFSPQVRYGWFTIQTTHPEEANFGYSSYWEIGMHNEFKIKKLGLFFRPRYQVSTILPVEENFEDERHKIYGVGLQAGLRINIR